MPTISEKRASFRKLHESGFFIVPNAWDAGSAVRLEKLGFKAIASTSAGAAWGLGKEDGEISLEEALAHLRLLVDATNLPVNADFENGFAHDPGETARNAVRAAETGVAGLSIEDWWGGAFYDETLAVERIAACRAALDPAVMLIGRHEKFREPTLPAADSIARAVAYAEAGADCIFVPGLADHGAIAELGARRCSVGGSLAAAAWAAFDAAAKTLRDYEP